SSHRARELEQTYATRRGHIPQLSISDDNHHVTEAIGDLYGEADYSARRSSRPLSFVTSPLGEGIDGSYFERSRHSPPQNVLGRTTSNERVSPPINGVHTRGRQGSFGSSTSPMSPPMLNRQGSDTAATQHFPLNDIDYESSPAAVAQELSNLQALRRMSMDVHMQSDPDLPSFNSSFRVPPSPPSSEVDEEDPSRLFWVPARLHPELAPKEFKTFIEDKVKTIKRTSGDEESLFLPEGVQRQGSMSSGGSLRRKKSMLSRQIDSPAGYEDGADRLERKKSLAGYRGPEQPTVQELDHLISDPNSLVQLASGDTARMSQDSGIEVPIGEDMPILPAKPSGGPALKRSTRTTYRRGSVRKGDQRVPFAKRIAQGRQAETDSDDSPVSPVDAIPHIPEFSLSRVQTEPIPQASSQVENFSRPGRRAPRTSPPLPSGSASSEDLTRLGRSDSGASESTNTVERRISHPPRQFHSRIASNGWTTAQLPGITPTSVPQIVETPPPPDGPRTYVSVQRPERTS
ncbi:hypothetical protein LTS18_008898, partial [Coniosporium uncinatum]